MRIQAETLHHAKNSRQDTSKQSKNREAFIQEQI